MDVITFLDKYKDVRKYSSSLRSYFDKVTKQSYRHTTRDSMEELQKDARPNEDPIYTKWRQNNLRHVTVDFVLQFQRMLQRVLSQTLTIDYKIEKLDRLIYNELIPLSIQDPNSKIVLFPFKEDQPEKAPSSSEFIETQKLKSKIEIIRSERIVEFNEDLLIYKYDVIEINKTKVLRYIGIDKLGYYILSPYFNEKKIIQYRIDVWYVHKFETLPVASLPAITINAVDNFGHTIHYKESICWPAFEWFDQGIVEMSSSQVASIKHANPKLVMTTDIECPTCEGHGFTGDLDDSGLIISSTKSVCRTCNGKRTIQQLSDFSTIKALNGNQPGDNANNNPVYYLNPPGGIKDLQNSFLMYFEMGKKSLTNDLLEGTGNESGIAKELRLQPRQDLMQSYGQQLCFMIEDIVNYTLLLEGSKEEDLVSVIPPSYYETKSPELLKLEVQNALQGERFLNYMKWVQNEYKTDELNVKLHKFAVLYAPLILYTSEEFNVAFNTGTYTEKDAIRRDYAFYAVGEILKKDPKIDDIKAIKDEADKLLIDKGILEDVTELEFGEEVRSKLLDTVGGG